MNDTWQCPKCTETYMQHWRDERDPAYCKSCADAIRGDCRAPDHDNPVDLPHLCYYREEETGGPCRYCGLPIDGQGPCSDCTETFEGMSTADIKALFAADAENAPEGPSVFEVNVVPPEGSQADER